MKINCSTHLRKNRTRLGTFCSRQLETTGGRFHSPGATAIPLSTYHWEWEPQRKGAVSCAAILVAHRRTAGQCFGSFFAQDIHTSPEPGNHRLQIHRIFFLKPKLQITKTDHATGVSVGARSPSFLLFVAVSRQNGQERLCRPMSPEFLFGGDQPDEEKVRPLRYCRAGCFVIFWLNRT